MQALKARQAAMKKYNDDDGNSIEEDSVERPSRRASDVKDVVTVTTLGLDKSNEKPEAASGSQNL